MVSASPAPKFNIFAGLNWALRASASGCRVLKYAFLPDSRAGCLETHQNYITESNSALPWVRKFPVLFLLPLLSCRSFLVVLFSFLFLQRGAPLLMSPLFLTVFSLLVSSALAAPITPQRFSARRNEGINTLQIHRRGTVSGDVGLGNNQDLCVFWCRH